MECGDLTVGDVRVVVEVLYGGFLKGYGWLVVWPMMVMGEGGFRRWSMVV